MKKYEKEFKEDDDLRQCSRIKKKKKRKGMRAANVIATFIKSTAIKYNTRFFQFLLNNPDEKRSHSTGHKACGDISL